MQKEQRRVLAQSLRRAQAGDHAACKMLYDVLVTPVYYGALRMLRSEHDATELTRDVLMQVFLGLGKMGTGEELMRATMRQTYQRSLTLLQEKGHLRPAYSGGGDDEALLSHLPAEFGSDPEQALRIHRALDRLGDEERAVALLHYYNGFDAEEISAILGFDLQLVEEILVYARRALARLIFPTERGTEA